jgi:hypothetical protein
MCRRRIRRIVVALISCRPLSIRSIFRCLDLVSRGIRIRIQFVLAHDDEEEGGCVLYSRCTTITTALALALLRSLTLCSEV